MFSKSLLKPSDYNILENLGEGPFGKTYLVENKIKRLSAVKVFRNAYDEEQKNFIKEIEFIGSSKCPELIAVKGCSQKDFNGNDNPVIWTEYFPESLDKKLNAHYNFSNSEKYFLILGISYGTQFLHLNKIKHLNLKPSNILLDSKNFPRVSDWCNFKIDKFIDNINNNIGLSPYMAPELIKDRHYSFKSDVYSFGLIAFEILTGDKSFTDLHKKFDSFDEIPKGIKPDLSLIQYEPFQNLVMKCLSSDPDERPTFDEIIEMLTSETITDLMEVTDKDRDSYYKFQCKQRADNGDPEAMNRMACMLLQGKKAKVYEKEIIRLLEMAVEKGNSSAMFNLANMLFLGQHTKRNKEKAIQLYEMAVKLNNSNALANYGYFLLTGDGVPKDKDKAFSYWYLSYIQGNTFGMLNLADAYRMGLGVQPNKQKAIELYEEIIKRKNSFYVSISVPEAMRCLAKMYRYGDGVQQDFGKAIKLLNDSIELDNEFAMCDLAEMFQYGEGVQQNTNEAERLYLMAIQNGCLYAEEKLSQMRKNIKGIPPNKEDATSYENINIIVIEFYDGLQIKKPKKWNYREIRRIEI